MTFRVRRRMIAEDGPGWAVTDYDDKPLPGRWATKDDAHEDGLLGVYLLSGKEAVEIDRHGRQVHRDSVGRYVVDEGFAFYITDCCDASAKGSMGATVCRACYTEIDPMLGGLPDRSEEN